MRSTGHIAVVALVAAAGSIACIASPARAGTPVEALWLNPASGNWGTAANWSTDPVFPQNSGMLTYNARINATGAMYTVSLDLNVTIDDLTIDASAGDAMLTLGNFNLTIQDQFSLTAGNKIMGGGTGQLVVNGPTSISGGNFANLPRFRTNGPTNFQSPLGEEFCDVDFEHSSTASWDGLGDFVLDDGSTFTTLPGATFDVRGDSAFRGTTGTEQYTNQGTLTRSTSSGTATIENIAFMNEADAVVQVASGSLSFSGAGTTLTNDGTLDIDASRTLEVVGGASLSNFSAGTLSGGVYDVAGTLRLDTGGAGLQTIDAAVTLDGPGSAIQNEDTTDALAATQTIAAAGTLTLAGSRDLTTAADFDVLGTLAVGEDSTFEVPAGSSLNGFDAAGTRTLSGGEFLVQGELRLDTGGLGIDTIDSMIVLDGLASAVVDSTGASALDTTDTISDDGQLELRNGRDFTTGGTFTVAPDGMLVVGLESVFEVPDEPGNLLTNFDAGVIADGNFEIRGTLRAPNLEVATIGLVGNPTTITLDGTESRFENFSGDAFAVLETIETGSTLALRNGRSLTTAGPLTVRGTLIIEGGAPRARGGAASTLSVGGTFTQGGGVMELRGGVIDVSGDYMLTSGTIAGEGTVRTSAAGRGTLLGTLDSAGIISPGSTRPGVSQVGTLTIASNYLQRGGAEFKIDVGGVNEGIDSDLVLIEGTAMFAPTSAGTLGSLWISVLPGWTPALGDSVVVARFASRTGQFESYFGLSLPGGLSLAPLWTDTTLSLVVVPAPASMSLVAGLGIAAARRRRVRLL